MGESYCPIKGQTETIQYKDSFASCHPCTPISRCTSTPLPSLGIPPQLGHVLACGVCGVCPRLGGEGDGEGDAASDERHGDHTAGGVVDDLADRRRDRAGK